MNQNFVENLPRKNTTITTFHAVSKGGTGHFTDFPNFCYRGCVFVSCHSNLHGNERGGTPGGAVHMHDSEKARNEHQNVLIHQVLGAWRTDFAVSRTPKPVMLFGVLKVAVPLGVHARPQQGLCLVISLRFLCSHAREYLFSRTCACCLHWRAPSCFLDVPMHHSLVFIGKVVTGSLPRILSEHVTCIHVCTKRYPDI